MSNSANQNCPQCGAPLGQDAPAGLCPKCLMALNLNPGTVFTDEPRPVSPPLPPEQIAPHFPQLEILECLGRGGMGVVYKARQKSLNRFAALKLLAPERAGDAKFAERFAREAQALASLNHANIVTIYDFGQAGGYYFLLMEFVDGLNLRQLLRAKKFTPEEALAIVPPLCDALQFAHDRGIVHRDIKPENLLIDKQGRVKVADFGIAKMLGGENGGGVGAGFDKATHGVVGTPGYSSPEQKMDSRRADNRADIYSLGVVFYEMLTGELPSKSLEPPSRKVHIDVRLDEVVLRALEQAPDLRYQQVSELKTDLQTIAASPAATIAPGAQAASKELAAVETWLALMDSGNYGGTWETAAGFFKRAITKEEWIDRAQSARRPAGRVISRQLRTERRFLSQYTVKFDTSFAGLKAAVETVTFSRQRDGQWQAIGYRILPAYAEKRGFSLLLKLFRALMGAWLFCSLFYSEGSASAAPSADKLKQLLQRLVDKKQVAPAMVIGVIDKKGVTVVGVGKREDGKPEEVNGDTLFEIGSITKVFTCLTLANMADNGEVQLDDPVAKFLPASVKVPSRNGQITLRSLATHSSGLPRLPHFSVLHMLMYSDNPYANFTADDLYEFLSSYKLPRDVGAESEYSNLGMGLLGQALALKAGTNYEALVVNRVCTPLKMDSTRITLTPELKERLAAGHNENGKRVSNWDFQSLAGCGALRSTANDLLKLLSAEMGLTPSPLATAMKETQTPQGTNGFMSEIGLAWQIDNDDGIIWHNGGTGGYRSYLGFRADKSLGVVVLCNSANDVDEVGRKFLARPRKHTVVKIDYSVYDRYVGQYDCSWAPGTPYVITREGDKLMAKLADQDTFEVYPESVSNFFYKVVDADLTFVTNETGAVTHLILHQNGEHLTAKKVK